VGLLAGLAALGIGGVLLAAADQHHNTTPSPTHSPPPPALVHTAPVTSGHTGGLAAVGMPIPAAGGEIPRRPIELVLAIDSATTMSIADPTDQRRQSAAQLLQWLITYHLPRDRFALARVAGNTTSTRLMAVARLGRSLPWPAAPTASNAPNLLSSRSRARELLLHAPTRRVTRAVIVETTLGDSGRAARLLRPLSGDHDHVIIITIDTQSTGATIRQSSSDDETITTVGRRPGAIASAAAHDLLTAAGVATAGYTTPRS
jgi:hypothetical protein